MSGTKLAGHRQAAYPIPAVPLLLPKSGIERRILHDLLRRCPEFLLGIPAMPNLRQEPVNNLRPVTVGGGGRSELSDGDAAHGAYPAGRGRSGWRG